MSVFDLGSVNPPSEEELDRLLGLSPGEEPEEEEEVFEPSRGERMLESFARSSQGLAPPRAPRSFLEGLVYGGVGGFQRAGERVAEARSAFEQRKAKRQAELDRARIEESRRRRGARDKLRGDIIGEQISRIGKESKEEKDDRPVATEALLQSAPWLARIYKPGDRIDTDVARMVKPPEQEPTDVLSLSPAGLELAARQYATMGSIPPMGRGKEATKVRQQIINRAAEVYPDLDLAANVADFQSGKATLTNLRRINDAAQAFANTAEKNADVLLEAMKDITDTGIPAFNTPIRNLQRHMLGSKELAAFDAARKTVIPEFARLLASPSASGQLTDTARAEIEEIVSGNMTINQMKAAIDILRRDAKNRTAAYEAQMQDVRKQMRNIGKSEGRTERPPLDSFVRP